MTSAKADPKQLGAFLMARRSELRPSDVGVGDGGRLRRVPGLRREEVAQLAAISTDYYTRLEQGRMSASAPVLASLARVLRLDDDQRTYLYELAGTRMALRSHGVASSTADRLSRRLLDHLDAPAMVTTRAMDILAWNDLAAALILDFGQVAEGDRNWLRLVFTDARLRRLFPDWHDMARDTVAYIRMESARSPDDLHLATLVDELASRDPRFRGWWDGHQVAARRNGTRSFDHPTVGPFTLEWATFTPDSDPDQQITVFTAEPGSPDAEALDRLRDAAANAATARP